MIKSTRQSCNDTERMAKASYCIRMIGVTGVEDAVLIKAPAQTLIGAAAQNMIGLVPGR